VTCPPRAISSCCNTLLNDGTTILLSACTLFSASKSRTRDQFKEARLGSILTPHRSEHNHDIWLIVRIFGVLANLALRQQRCTDIAPLCLLGRCTSSTRALRRTRCAFVTWCVSQTALSEIDAGGRLLAGWLGSTCCLSITSQYLCLRNMLGKRVVIQWEYADRLCARVHRGADPQPPA
jgi:hypothetical protein